MVVVVRRTCFEDGIGVGEAPQADKSWFVRVESYGKSLGVDEEDHRRPP